MESFIQQMAEKHRKAVNEFGIPERIVLAEDVKLWRFTGKVDVVFREESWSWPDIVPVYSGEDLIGAATILPVAEGLVASVTATHDLPERLDFENGEVFTLIADKSYIDPVTVSDDTTYIRIKRLKLVRFPTSKDPISTWETL